MNIGTLGAATILMNNNTRMMRGGGGGGSNSNDNEKPKGLGKMLLVMTLVVIGTWVFHMKPDFWYVEVEQQIVAKQMLKEETNKGKTYNACYIQVKTNYVEENFQWNRRDSTLWIECRQRDYLNYNIGHVVNETIVKPSLQGWSTLLTWVAMILTLIWIFILAAIMATWME
jgi:hypothetical protein